MYLYIYCIFFFIYVVQKYIRLGKIKSPVKNGFKSEFEFQQKNSKKFLVEKQFSQQDILFHLSLLWSRHKHKSYDPPPPPPNYPSPLFSTPHPHSELEEGFLGSKTRTLVTAF
jgi:hypothetical protein